MRTLKLVHNPLIKREIYLPHFRINLRHGLIDETFQRNRKGGEALCDTLTRKEVAVNAQEGVVREKERLDV